MEPGVYPKEPIKNNTGMIQQLDRDA